MDINQKANELSRLAMQKGHIEAVRRLQQSLVLEMREAGVKGVNISCLLAELNSVIGFYEDKISGEHQNALFELGGA